MKKLLLPIILLLSLTSCSQDSSNSTGNQDSNMRSIMDDAERMDETGISSKMYTVRFISLWNQTDHFSTPTNGHFSPIVTATHSSDYSLFPKGELASAGFQRVAEFGQTSVINSEINSALSNGDVGSSINTENQFMFRDGVLEQSFDITATKDHPLFSFITMIAPSPDWVVGLSNVDLYNEDGFINEAVEIDLFAYHAGTQEGDFGGNFSLGQQATSPKQPISKLSGPGLDAAFARVIITPIN